MPIPTTVAGRCRGLRRTGPATLDGSDEGDPTVAGVDGAGSGGYRSGRPADPPARRHARSARSSTRYSSGSTSAAEDLNRAESRCRRRPASWRRPGGPDAGRWPGGTTGDGRRLLVEGLGMAIADAARTPVPTPRLADIGPGDRLDELAFDLRLGEAGRRPPSPTWAGWCSAHLVRTIRLRRWADGLAGGAIDVELAGYLTGSIDLIAPPGRRRDTAASWWPTTRRTR